MGPDALPGAADATHTIAQKSYSRAQSFCSRPSASSVVIRNFFEELRASAEVFGSSVRDAFCFDVFFFFSS